MWPIFPLPQEIQKTKDYFKLDENTLIALPKDALEQDLFLARFFVAEISDRYGFPLKIEYLQKLPLNNSIILIGAIDNSLVRAYCEQNSLKVTSQNPGPEGYFLEVKKSIVVIAGSDNQGTFYGMQSLRQLIKKEDNHLQIEGVRIRDWPYKPFRGLRLYLPGQENIPFFKRFVRNFMALYKFNKLFLEVNAGMRLDKHPELNVGWIEFAKDLKYSRRNYPREQKQRETNSTHYDAVDGGVIEKEEVADLVQYANKHCIEVIPEIPSLSHSYYLLARHRELAEVQNAEWPDTYCPSNPRTYELLFDVFDEYIEVMKPKMIHIGHDEWLVGGECPRCKGKDTSELFTQDVIKIYNYLKKKEIKVAMWGDHLVDSIRGKGKKIVSPGGYTYYCPSSSKYVERIPKDILVLNWFWRKPENESDAKVEKLGFKQIYGNFKPDIENYSLRSTRSSIIGGTSSSWAATNEFNFGKDLVYDFLGCANLLWSKHWSERKKLYQIVQYLIPEVRKNFKGKIPSSEDRDPLVPVKISSYFNMTTDQEIFGVNFEGLKAGRVKVRNKVFELFNASKDKNRCAIIVGNKENEKNPLPGKIKGIKINEDVSSLIFLHACARPAQNRMAYSIIFNFPDTADLLGHYEIVYEDGLVEIIPIRYGINILEWSIKKDPNQGNYCYEADPVDCSIPKKANSITFFAYEWTNPRFGKKIKEVHLINSKGFKAPTSPFTYMPSSVESSISNNAIILLAISFVKKRIPLEES